MPFTISFELSDRDIERFVAMAKEAKEAVSGETLSAEQIAAGARKIYDEAQQAELPDFIAERLGNLNVLAAMITDPEWKLPEEEMERALSAMAYFSNPEDLIPDRVPVIGFLDDAIMADLVVQNLIDEIEAYQEFCVFRTAEEQRRANRDDSETVHREDWLASKRAALHSRMRQRRSARRSSGGWSTKLW